MPILWICYIRCSPDIIKLLPVLSQNSTSFFGELIGGVQNPALKSFIYFDIAR